MHEPSYEGPRIGDSFRVVLPEWPDEELAATVSQLHARQGRPGVLLDLGQYGQRWVPLDTLEAFRLNGS
jgi:hypothetical protein